MTETQTQPSAAAMRAAAVYFMGTAEVEPGWTPGDGILNLARIIDRETGLPELLAVVRALVDSPGFGDATAPGQASDADGGPVNVTCLCQETIDAARAAIAKATKDAPPAGNPFDALRCTV